MNATIEIKNNQAIVKAPYNAAMVDEIKNIPNRKWDGITKAWIVPAEFAGKAQEIIDRYFGEAVEKEIIRLRITGGNTYKRTYPHGVSIDGYDLITPWGNISRDCAAFKVLDCKGGFTRGDARHAFDVEYEVTLEIRKGARIERTGRASYQGSFEVL